MGSTSKDDSATSVGRFVSILYRYWQIHLDRELADLGIGAAQVPILAYLYRVDGVSQAEIVRYLRIDKGAVARTIRKLVEQGLVERVPDPHDGRAWLVRLTPRAQEVRCALGEKLGGWTEYVSQDLSEEEFAHLMEMMERMRVRAEELVRGEASP